MSIALSVFFAAISASLLYFYLIHRNEEKLNFNKLFEYRYSKNCMILAGAAFAAGMAACICDVFIHKMSVLHTVTDVVMMAWLVVLAGIDYKEQIIPNKLIVAGFCVGFLVNALRVAMTPIEWKQVLLGAFVGAGVCGGILFIVAIVVKTALGMGDVKLFTVLGFVYGLTSTYSILLVSIFVMAILSIVLLIAKKVTRKTAIPMAPFVAIGFAINILIGM